MLDRPPLSANRTAMIESQLKPCGVIDPRVLQAMAAVPREDFVAQGRRALAYADLEQPLAPGRAMMTPLTLGLMVQAARVEPGERALVVGAGTGYAAAVLGRMGAEVVALEESPTLAARARALVAGHGRVTVVEGPLARGAPDRAPFDLILIDGAAERLPAELVAQLDPRGRLVAVIVDEDGVHRLGLGRASPAGVAFDWLAELHAPPLEALRAPPMFRF
ncbi:MAG: protein-L-isoaspartate O-methyltransferase [Sphingomonadaceae bacterium]|uniref:protein-L-isoaspartate O-methyltransferase family protein n=1 Tax=Thermaurantiacus sp. TaxID=2820283 RepID=UPI00298F1E5A|nr:protein-L-isoaspartate O-methyltransferase [Thermaurantiacus sp.]MCS6986613.1 protein-L-isoaspartate O-methyltransferase [Sphingomonadaceae bacterium]MDW8414126.1 protein-L-isoaspartate O-methyltransferase [Thermaurantiacus sp.]